MKRMIKLCVCSHLNVLFFVDGCLLGPFSTQPLPHVSTYDAICILTPISGRDCELSHVTQ